MITSQFHMIDVGHKQPTHRLAVATGRIIVGERAFLLIDTHQLPKGDPLILAEIAGIQGAKKTAELIPLCHPLPLEQIEVLLTLEASQYAIHATAFVSTTAKTGVEMEALSAVNAALLTVYDLTKMVEPHLLITDVKLLLKQGGKQGLWLTPSGVPDWILEKITPPASLSPLTFAVVTISDRASLGQYDDRSGQWLCDILKDRGGVITAYDILPDDIKPLQSHLLAVIESPHPDVIFTTGGTGIAPRDITPEAILALADKVLPGLGEYLRAYGSQFTPYSWISRSQAVIVRNTLIISLPGHPSAVKEGLTCLTPLLPHLIETLRGGSHDLLS